LIAVVREIFVRVNRAGPGGWRIAQETYDDFVARIREDSSTLRHDGGLFTGDEQPTTGMRICSQENRAFNCSLEIQRNFGRDHGQTSRTVYDFSDWLRQAPSFTFLNAIVGDHLPQVGILLGVSGGTIGRPRRPCPGRNEQGVVRIG
jgi:hypothetical protein